MIRHVDSIVTLRPRVVFRPRPQNDRSRLAGVSVFLRPADMGSKEMIPDEIVYRSKVRATVHEAMQNLYGVGLIDQDSMRAFDELCLTRAAAKVGGKMRRNGAASAQASYFAASPAE